MCWPRLSIAIALGLVLASLAQAAPAVREGFEGPEISWKPAGADGQYKIASHSRTTSVSHTGRGCEQIQIVGNGGTYIYLSHDVGPAPLIGELALGVWIKSDRAGLQILARVVLPRSKNPATGQPLSMLLAGSGYTQVGSWQELRLENLPQLFERQLRVLRAEHGPSVDGHEAFIDRVVLNAYGGPGTTTTWIDDLVLTGFVGTPNPLAGTSGEPSAQRLPGTDRTVPDEVSRPAAARLSGAGLMVGDQPYFPRILEYRGEPLSLVKQLGFNGIWLPTAAGAELMKEAAAVGLRIVAPPPSVRELQAMSSGGSGGIDSQYDPILVWDLGSALSTKELDANKRWSQLVHSNDSRTRPLICGADCDLWSYSRNVDLLWVGRSPLGSSLGLTPYLAWMRERPQWARGGTPPWTMIQTQPSERLIQQAGLLAGGAKPQPGSQDEQFRLLVFSALAAGARGICFQSSTPLSASDPATRHRAMLLELINLELDLVEPWCAGGSYVTSASGDDNNMGAAVMQTDRARLVLPLPSGSFNQFALPLPVAAPQRNPFKKPKGRDIAKNLNSPPPVGSTYSHVPGVPESNQAYELSPVAFRVITQSRTAGGVRLMLSDENRSSLFVLTQDSTVVANLTRRMQRVRSRGAELTRELAKMHLARVDDVYARLAADGHVPEETKGWLEQARGLVGQAETQAAAHNDQQAFYLARRADQYLRHVERASWDLTLQPVVAPLATALGTSFDTLPEYWQFMTDVATATRGPNLLPAGDFEDRQAALNSGWRYFQHPPSADRLHPEAGLATSVDFSTDPIHGGKQALRLAVTSTDPKEKEDAVVQVETAPMWLTTAPIQVEAGRIVLIHGWINIPKRIQGSVDGLMIVDSLGGEPLAERILQTRDWQEFSLYRAAPNSGPMTVTFALSGTGEAFLDDVTIQLIERTAPAAAMPQSMTQQTAPPNSPTRRPDQQFTAPPSNRQPTSGRATVRPQFSPMQIGTMFQKSF